MLTAQCSCKSVKPDIIVGSGSLLLIGMWTPIVKAWAHTCTKDAGGCCYVDGKRDSGRSDPRTLCAALCDTRRTQFTKLTPSCSECRTINQSELFRTRPGLRWAGLSVYNQRFRPSLLYIRVCGLWGRQWCLFSFIGYQILSFCQSCQHLNDTHKVSFGVSAVWL